VLIDENWQIWLMEVNANPSLNVYNDRELPNGDIEQTLSEIDKFIKTNLVADTLSLVSTAPIFQNKKQKEAEPPQPNTKVYKSALPKEQGCLRLILPHQSKPYSDLYLYSHAERIFEYLAGQKSYDFITTTQF
jgi:hypothetical protein